MTKKDYELIASAFDIGWLVQHYPHMDGERTNRRIGFNSALDHEVQTARRLASKLEKLDPKFDKVRFLRLCGLSDNLLIWYGEIERPDNWNLSLNRV